MTVTEVRIRNETEISLLVWSKRSFAGGNERYHTCDGQTKILKGKKTIGGVAVLKTALF